MPDVRNIMDIENVRNLSESNNEWNIQTRIVYRFQKNKNSPEHDKIEIVFPL